MSDKGLVGSLPAPLRAWVERGVGWVKALSHPLRVLLASTAVALALLVAYVGVRSSDVPYAVLFMNLDREDAAAVVAKLKEMKVPYRVEGDGTTVDVPEAKARELRLELAGAGLPRGGAVGFESFDKMRLGATEFEQRILYRRALEGELARTIGTVAAIQSARVHLVLPEKSVFVSKNEPSSASVVLKLRSGRALGGGEVAGIVHLVSTSVAGLSPERVTVVTTEGAILHKPRRPGDDADADDRASQARSLEATLEERARAMVEKVTGPGRVDVRVTADLDPSRVERVEDHYDPSRVALRSEERSVERASDAIPVAGVPGAESNLPTGAALGAVDAGAPSFGSTGRESHTRNFEVDRVTEKRVTVGGVLRRLTVAVVIDGAPAPGEAPRSSEEIDKIASLVRSAVGFDERRGDVVTVEAVPFLAAEAPAVAEPTPATFDPKNVAPFAVAALALALVLATLLVVRARRRRERASALALVADRERASVEAVAVEVLGPEPKAPAASADDLRRKARELAALDPATAALIVRGWLGQHDERGAPAAQEKAA